MSRQDVQLVFRLKFTEGREGSTATAAFWVADAANALQFPETDVAWTYRDHAANDAKPRNLAVDRVVAPLSAAKARAEALELNRAGRFDEARELLEKIADRIAVIPLPDLL